VRRGVPVPTLASMATLAGTSSLHDEYTEHCLELLGSLGPCQVLRMFGGHGIYLDGLMFGLIAGERLYLKVDAQTRPQWEAAGGEPFVFTARGRLVATSYYTPPDEAMESPALMRPWARLALEAALRARAAKPALRKSSTAAQGRARPRGAKH